MFEFFYLKLNHATMLKDLFPFVSQTNNMM